MLLMAAATRVLLGSSNDHSNAYAVTTLTPFLGSRINGLQCHIRHQTWTQMQTVLRPLRQVSRQIVLYHQEYLLCRRPATQRDWIGWYTIRLPIQVDCCWLFSDSG